VVRIGEVIRPWKKSGRMHSDGCPTRREAESRVTDVIEISRFRKVADEFGELDIFVSNARVMCMCLLAPAARIGS